MRAVSGIRPSLAPSSYGRRLYPGVSVAIGRTIDNPRRPAPYRAVHSSNSGGPDVEKDVLDRFLYSRGIVDDATRAQLVDMSLRGVEDREEQILASTADDYVPPGVSSTWDIQRSVASGDGVLPDDVAFAAQRTCRWRGKP